MAISSSWREDAYPQVSHNSLNYFPYLTGSCVLCLTVVSVILLDWDPKYSNTLNSSTSQTLDTWGAFSSM